MKPEEFRALLTQLAPDFEIKPNFEIKAIHLRIANSFWPMVRCSYQRGVLIAVQCQNIMLRHSSEYDFSEELENIRQLLSIGIEVRFPLPDHPALVWFNAVFGTKYGCYDFESKDWCEPERGLVWIGLPNFAPDDEPCARLSLSYENPRWWKELSKFSEPLTSIVIFAGDGRPATSVEVLYCNNAQPLVWRLLEMVASESCLDTYNHVAYNAFCALFGPTEASDAFIEATYPGTFELRLHWVRVDGRRVYDTWVFPKFIHMPIIKH